MNTEKIKKQVYQVQGMTCSGCERAVQRVVSNLNGITSAKVDFASASLSTEYDPSIVTNEDIKLAVNKIGYKLTEDKMA
jgi:copper chaperone CopZ